MSPAGHRLIESFRLEGTTPVWIYALADALVEKRVWMQQGANTTYVSYKLVRGSGPVGLQIKVLVNYRDYHASTHGSGWRMNIDPVEHGIRVAAFEGAAPFRLLSLSAAVEPAHDWYYNFDLAVERGRGLDDREDHLHAATFRSVLSRGKEVTIVATAEASPNLDVESANRARTDHEQALLQRWVDANRSTANNAPGWIRQLMSPAAPGRFRRPIDHRRVSLVWRLGTRHDDRASGAHHHDGTAGNCRKDSQDIRAFRRSRDAAQRLPRRRPGARIQHR